jgi:hypothetical protein
MMRSAAQLSKADLTVAPHLLRSKTFIPKLDKNNEVYYVLAKKGLANNPDPDREYDFFEMPNLLLDLDAEGTRNVRALEDADENLMKTRWAEVPRRTAVKARLKVFEEQVYESRRRARQILTQPANIWRITPHDIVSAALHGAPGPQRKPARESTPAALISEQTSSPTYSGAAGIVEQLRVENGIPPHANNQDQLLLHWMMLRHKSLATNAQKRQPAAPSPKQLAEALQGQTTIVGVRRLVSQALSSGTSVARFQDETRHDTSLPHQIRSTCVRILSQDTSNRELCLQTLTFLGNLSERLSSVDAHLGPLLCGLALKLSADIGSLEALTGWLYRSHQTGNNGNLPLEDVLSALASLRSSLSHEPPATQTIEQRQLLFQLLTGIDENNAIASDSFRAFGTTCPEGDASGTAKLVYAAYIALLGRLGAARTLWREWRQLPSFVTREEEVVLGFCSALKQATHVMPAGDGEGAPDLSLDDCATLDYHAIEMQDAASWRDGTQHSQLRDKVADCTSTLDLPLAECIRVARAW